VARTYWLGNFVLAIVSRPNDLKALDLRYVTGACATLLTVLLAARVPAGQNGQQCNWNSASTGSGQTAPGCRDVKFSPDGEEQR